MVENWEGLEVEEEDLESEIWVWEIDPHLSGSHDIAVTRGWNSMLNFIGSEIGNHLEDKTKEDLIEGVNINIRLRKITLKDYLEILDEN